MTGVIGVSLAPVSNPSSCSPALNDAVFDHSRSSRSGSSLDDVERRDARGDRRRAARSSRTGRAGRGSAATRSAAWGPAMNPPSTPIAFESVPTWMSTRPCRPKWSTVPAPPVPRTPDACASSIIMIAPCRSATSTSAGSGAMSPSIENTPSVISSCRRPGLAVSAQERVGGVGVLVREHLDLGAREPRAVDDRRVVQCDRSTITSSLSRIAATVPAFAVNPDWNISASSACLKLGEPPLELTVQRHRAGDRAHRAASRRRARSRPSRPRRSAEGGSPDPGSCSTRG